MADPYLDGDQNLVACRQYIENHLIAARNGDTMIHLGAAGHAIEDSFSEGHVWRGDAANYGDPTAPIECFNVFNWEPGVQFHQFSLIEGTTSR